MKDWKEICDEIFCAWMKFESNTYKCALSLHEEYLVVYIQTKCSITIDTLSVFKNELTESKIEKIIKMIDEYSDNEVIENLDFQQEKNEEMLTAAERDKMAIEQIF